MAGRSSGDAFAATKTAEPVVAPARTRDVSGTTGKEVSRTARDGARGPSRTEEVRTPAATERSVSTREGSTERGRGTTPVQADSKVLKEDGPTSRTIDAKRTGRTPGDDAGRSTVERESSERADRPERTLTVREDAAKSGAMQPRQIDPSRTPVARKSGVADSHEHSGGVSIVGNNNNVYINGGVNGSYPLPYRAGRSHTRIFGPGFGLYNHNWDNCGWYFSLRWSSHSCGRIVSYYYDPYDYWGVSYWYPNYHRKYVFCSIGGYWPDTYRYRRYYWYGCHPYRWYGAYIADQPVVYDTYNTYNTYNTYDTYTTTSAPANGDYYYDASREDFSDIRNKLRQEDVQGAEDLPAEETTADACFSQAVDLFGQGMYEQAVFKLRVAMILDPQDVVLPYAYIQTLFASGDYDGASAALDRTLRNMPAEKEKQTVYYPRGLYEDEKLLNAQIDKFGVVAASKSDNAAYKLLLGYQLLGSGRLDEAITPLHQSLEAEVDNSPSMILIDLLEKIKADNTAAVEQAQQKATDAVPPAQSETAVRKDGP